MKKMEIKYIKIWNALTNIDEKNKIKQHIHEKMWEYYTKWLEISEHKCIIKLQRTFVLIYTTERRVQSNIAQKNMQEVMIVEKEDLIKKLEDLNPGTKVTIRYKAKAGQANKQIIAVF